MAGAPFASQVSGPLEISGGRVVLNKGLPCLVDLVLRVFRNRRESHGATSCFLIITEAREMARSALLFHSVFSHAVVPACGYEGGGDSGDRDCGGRIRIASATGASKGQRSTPKIRTGISMSASPRFSKSQTNCSKYETPVDISSAKDLTGTISTPASINPRRLKIVILAQTL